MYFVTSLISCTSCVSDQLINKEVLGPEFRLLLSKRRNYFQSLQSLSPPGSDERKYFSMVVSRKLGGNGNYCQCYFFVRVIASNMFVLCCRMKPIWNTP